MSSLKQNIRSVLADVEIFLVETLKSVKLNSGAKDHKDRLLEKIKQLLDEIPGSASSQPESNISGGSGSGTSSGNLQGLADDESGYADNVTKVAVSDLKNKLQTGMLDKKKKSGFKTWEPLYCVVSGNVFYMYKKQTDSKQKEAFCLSGYEFHEAPGLEKDTTKKDMCFEVTKAGAPTYQFRAGSKEGMVIWKEAITKGIQIAAEEDPGDNYEQAGPYVGTADRPYVSLHVRELTSDDEDESWIYDDVDDLPSYHAPPVPPATTLPLPDTSQASVRYANLPSSRAEQQKKTSSLNRASAADDSHGNHSTSDAEDEYLVPSQVKALAKPTGSAQSGGNKRQGPPPMIDIYEESASENVSRNPQEKRANTAAPSNRNSMPGGKFTDTKAAATNQARLKSSANPSKKRDLPALPTSSVTSGSKVGQGEGKGRGALPPPSSPEKSSAQSSTRASPPLVGPGVRDLKKMFQS